MKYGICILLFDYLKFVKSEIKISGSSDLNYNNEQLIRATRSGLTDLQMDGYDAYGQCEEREFKLQVDSVWQRKEMY